MRTSFASMFLALLVGVTAVQQVDAQVSVDTVLVPMPDSLIEPEADRGYTGFEFVMVATVSQDRQLQSMTVTVDEVHAGSPAERAGLQVGDEIIGVNGQDIRDRLSAMRMRSGVRYDLRIRRGERELQLHLVPS